ncbi:UBA domain-containing protein Mud1 [Schizosaccharomyces japonicus yFS275]|uniref:UBA domain-containing protein Mud1 n=1 Tax=Schizosaccharomyces japonicus (strain yFS275 / FY16936) TaxID=402676 RepID=B6K2W4_SCHJY|nr:UBA domain-containing protein Mud1 [Schizosaccharomyces japonicus yFS275]EEB08604.1 UBA domain-containing protein Mud1 [Schizosaccharomyces japonicus yFS275]
MSVTIYFWYLFIHLIFAFLVDLPVGEWLGPYFHFLSGLRYAYLKQFRDPILLEEAAWKRSFFLSEAFIQIPFLFWASYQLYKLLYVEACSATVKLKNEVPTDENKTSITSKALLAKYDFSVETLFNNNVHLILGILIYSVHSGTTTIACIAELLERQQWTIVCFYAPYVIVPLWMTVDTSKRILLLTNRRTNASSVAASRQNTLLANPELLQRVQSMFPQLAQAVRSPSAFEQAWLSINPASFFTSASLNNSSMQFSSEVADEDLMAVAVQQRIEEQIRQDAIAENMQTALENHPETFTQVPMLYVPVEVNGQPVKAFVDSGAQATIASSDCIRRCNLTHLIDKRFSGVARGVGTAKIVGVIHSAPLKIGKLFLPCKFTVLEQQDVDLLLGLDMLRRYQACIDLNENVLCFHSERIPFLPESEIPKAKPIIWDQRFLPIPFRGLPNPLRPRKAF